MRRNRTTEEQWGMDYERQIAEAADLRNYRAGQLGIGWERNAIARARPVGRGGGRPGIGSGTVYNSADVIPD
jgi:hypothetical protein